MPFVVMKVGSLGTVRPLQKDLNRIAKSQYWLCFGTQIIAFLVNVKRSVEECEKQFNRLSIKERVKFDEETLVNVNNIKMKSAKSQSFDGLRNDFIVVTIIVAAHGVVELPPIKSTAQLKEALQKLATIPSSKIMGVEVLWAPQKEDDSLTEQEMLEYYPLLRPL
ncbi:hypothetical protein M8C21_029203 [Ambrosia artemisiifolia]|uniref:DUF1517 domain-containing protein n=1 Tax=Ambrosia artemisiifolia TaxID=4212 RepID=A0AAD5D409_AMBAR|nr:hypothetical protein M8C21_029203 [Ambrosia artemisiifolia]